MRFRAQGATEYLVLLAVVLVIALVGIALLGFFPGTASDAQIAESQIYWKSASPIAMTEMDAMSHPTVVLPYLRVRNVGTYPIRITKLLGNNNNSITQLYTELGYAQIQNISDHYYLAPGEEKHFGINSFEVARREMYFTVNNPGTVSLAGLSVACINQPNPPHGHMTMNNFGFEYVQYIEGQTITKRQVGSKPLIMKCTRWGG